MFPKLFGGSLVVKNINGFPGVVVGKAMKNLSVKKVFNPVFPQYI